MHITLLAKIQWCDGYDKGKYFGQKFQRYANFSFLHPKIGKIFITSCKWCKKVLKNFNHEIVSKHLKFEKKRAISEKFIPKK